MAMVVKDVIEWLRTLPAKDAVYVDELGLMLLSELDENAYLEIGGQRQRACLRKKAKPTKPKTKRKSKRDAQ
jgi:hypothetical protein